MISTSNQLAGTAPRARGVGAKAPVWVLGTALIAIVAIFAGCGEKARPPASPTSLFNKLGGMAPMQRWVDEFAWRLAADPEIGDTFVRTDLGGLKSGMLSLACSITGGGCAYDIEKLAPAHEGLAVTDRDIERFLSVASESASAVGLPKEPSAEMIERLRTLGARLGTVGDRVGSDR